jgi:hypothetical protein
MIKISLLPNAAINNNPDYDGLPRMLKNHAPLFFLLTCKQPIPNPS